MENALRRHVQHLAEDKTVVLLSDLGYDVHANGHNDHADLIVNGTLRVEVKGALWTKHRHSRGRYQFNTRQEPDLFILWCLCEYDTVFVIPRSAIGERANIAIWSRFPSNYSGQWMPYRQATHLIQQELERCHQHTASNGKAS